MNFWDILEVILSILFLITLTSSIVMLIKVKNEKKIKIFLGYIAEIFFISIFTAFLKTEIVSTAVNDIGLLVCSVLTLFEIKKIFENEKEEQTAPFEPKTYSAASTTAKKFLPVLTIIPFVFGVIFLVFSKIDADKTKEKYKDINGPTNYELNTLTEDDFSTKPYNYLTVGSKHFGKGDATFRDKSEDDEFTEDSDIVTFIANELYGIKIIQETKTDSDTVILDIKNKHKAGNCKIVILVNNKIHKELMLNSKETVTIENANNKLIEVVVAGEEANIELEISREY